VVLGPGSSAAVGRPVGRRYKNDDNESNECSSVSDSLIASGFCRRTTAQRWGRFPATWPCPDLVRNLDRRPPISSLVVYTIAVVRMSYDGRVFQWLAQPTAPERRRPATPVVQADHDGHRRQESIEYDDQCCRGRCSAWYTASRDLQITILLSVLVYCDLNHTFSSFTTPEGSRISHKNTKIHKITQKYTHTHNR